MATAEIKAVITAKDEASTVVNNFGKNVDKASVGVGLAVAAMGTAAIAFGVQSVSAFAESERATVQLEKVLKSTGGAAGITKDAAISLSKSLQELTGIDDDAILAGENLMLTFTNIGSDVFPEATKAALDMATAMNNGVKPNAEQLRGTVLQLGKALQDPDAGLGALKRVGVNVDELAAKFTAGMPIQEKQKLILQELGTEFGGSADKTGSFSDKLLTLQTNFGNLQEKIGEVLTTAISPLLEKLNTWIEKNPELAEKSILAATAVAGLTVVAWGLNAAVNVLSTSIGILNGVMNTAFGRFGILVAGISGVYYWFQLLANIVNHGTNQIANFNQNILNSIARVRDAGGWLGRLAGYFLNINQAAYSAASAIDNLIHRIPIIGQLLPKMQQLNFPGRAMGGPVSSNTPYVVGERGPELFVPNNNGSIIPNHKLGGDTGGSGSTTININVGLMTGSAIERREAAMKMFEDLQDIASQRGQTVGQLIGA